MSTVASRFKSVVFPLAAGPHDCGKFPLVNGKAYAVNCFGQIVLFP